MPDTIFAFLFKYRPVVFENGRLVLEAAQPFLLTAVALAIVLASALAYLRQRARAGSGGVATLIALRTVTVALLLFVLLKPVMSLSTVVPGENFLAVLIDDSRSMQLADDGEVPRGTAALATFTDASGGTIEDLQERFTLRYYRFSDLAGRMDPARPLAFQGRSTNIGSALEYVRQDMAGVPLAGAVLVTDGADNADTTLTDPLLQFKSRGIPVYTVGVGDERFQRDIEISRVEGPDRVLMGSAFAVDVMINQQGFDGRTVTLVVEEEGSIANTQEITFARGQPGTTVRVNLTAGEEGPRDFRFSIEPQRGERVAENNERHLLLMVDDRREKILYFEGEPRFEVKFLRQAIANDENVQVVVLQRTAENKYLRLGVDGPLELAGGFPDTREELFAYRALILGSVEASYFTHNQLQIIEEFVSQRGGGLLFLGGRHSFAEGGYAGTPLENVLPVRLDEAPTEDAPFLSEVLIAPTTTGLAHSAIQLGSTLEESEERWETLPTLTTINPLYRAKPGADVLLTGSPVEGGEDLIVLATQFYGRGRVVSFAVQDSWLWQMHAEIPLDDMTHERLWRQMLRWLVSSVPNQIELEMSRTRFSPGEPVTIRAEVSDSGFLGVNGATVDATITDPTGMERSIPLEWSVEEDGEYEATFVPDQMGAYHVRVDADYAGTVIGAGETEGVAADLPTEFFGAEMQGPLLRRIADETGGRFYTLDDVSGLAEDARFTESGKTVVETFELWDMPVVLILLLLAIGGEWALRRRRGLA